MARRRDQRRQLRRRVVICPASGRVKASNVRKPRTMTRIADLETPAALIDISRMQHNISRMQGRMNALAVKFRPHVKTSKCLPVVQAQLAAGAQGITVSTLKEAEQFLAAGMTDILYAVGIV